MASLVGLKHSDMKRFVTKKEKTGVFVFPSPVCLLLTEIERFFLKKYTNDIVEKVIPVEELSA